jgi:hypothetical protein
MSLQDVVALKPGWNGYTEVAAFDRPSVREAEVCNFPNAGSAADPASCRSRCHDRTAGETQVKCKRTANGTIDSLFHCQSIKRIFSTASPQKLNHCFCARFKHSI